MNLRVSNLVADIAQSEIRNMSLECDRLGGINMSQGICDLELPLPVLEGAHQALNEGVNHYTRFDGLERLRISIAEKMLAFNKIKADPKKNIIVTSGATGALYSACLALLNRGDEVIIFQPYYGYHISTFKAAGIQPKYATLTPPNWSIDFDELERIVTPRTRGILICTPSNPTGKVFSKSELDMLALFAIKHDLFVFTDEIYEYFVYDKHKHISPGSIDAIAERTITISGYSKTFSITGWRIGYVICHEKWAEMIGYVSDLIYVCAPAPLQIGVAQGVERLPKEFYDGLCSIYNLKRQKICSTLSKVGLNPYVPQGAYYVLANVEKIPGKSSKEKAMHILKKVGVATVPGDAFYASNDGGDLVRFCFAKSDEILDEASFQLMKL